MLENDFPMTEHVVPAWSTRAKRRRPGWTDGQKAKLKELWFVKPPIPAEILAEMIEAETSTVYAWAHRLGLPRRTGRGTHLSGKRKTSKKKRNLPRRGGDQRRFVGVENSKGPRIVLNDYHPAIRKQTTFFPKLVKPAGMMIRLLKSAVHSRKIGAVLEKGRWKGQPIYTLTLEERDTCPRSCKEFATCYGNNMPFSERIHDDGTLTRRLWGELASLAAEYPDGFIVRLHALGDFYSVDYVNFWRQALIDFPGLNIFGFTARIPPDPIGVAVAELTRDFYERFRMRFSGAGYAEDCSEVVETPDDVQFVRCPAETDPNRCCASCGLCINSNVSISFVRH